MPSEFGERRTAPHLRTVVDEALEMVHRCGWRYALAYLISENVSHDLIQRLLAGSCVRTGPRTGIVLHNVRDQELARLLVSRSQRAAATREH